MTRLPVLLGVLLLVGPVVAQSPVPAASCAAIAQMSRCLPRFESSWAYGSNLFASRSMLLSWIASLVCPPGTERTATATIPLGDCMRHVVISITAVCVVAATLVA